MSRYHFEDRKLRKDSKRKKIAGVCAGIARYLDIPRLPVRLAAIVALCIMPEPTLIAYGLAYLILDDEEKNTERSRKRYYDS
ncbi:MAG: phage shock protein C [Candidatus Azotimanducaceae bacterium]|jgi:phage shock protein C